MRARDYRRCDLRDGRRGSRFFAWLANPRLGGSVGSGKRERAGIVASKRDSPEISDDDRADDSAIGAGIGAMLGAMPALVDGWLMDLFPGRTLEELDGVDYLRLQRALDAKRIAAAEDKRKLYLDGTLKGDQMSPSEWVILRDNDRMIADGA